ncbi:MAG: hypothetical protein NWF04_05140 [Candidatus Bathyarchaeota archaeon]|nr:hypothetical protein [Candidatus Bathyarchaeota archaeon]
MQIKLLSKTIIIAVLLVSMLSVGIANAAEAGPLSKSATSTPGATHGSLFASIYVYYDDQTYAIDWSKSSCSPSYAPGLGDFSQDTLRNLQNPYNCEAYISGSFDPWFADDWSGYAQAWAYPSYLANQADAEAYWTWD